MKYMITVNETTYEVELENINARPIIAHVNHERFEVMPVSADANKTGPAANPKTEKAIRAPKPLKGTASSDPEVHGKILTSPLPGTVVEVFVKAGDEVESGHVMLVIEAMKMKNSIRSSYSGTVSEVLVNTGQSVAHKQALIKFVDPVEA
jgi:biotin carboxyl carrier protein